MEEEKEGDERRDYMKPTLGQRLQTGNQFIPFFFGGSALGHGKRRHVIWENPFGKEFES
jgi:hypothetical protein